MPGYHIEDQRPAPRSAAIRAARCWCPSDEQIKRLNTARFQLDIMRVPGIIVARTDAEAANLIDSRADERDQPFLLGATNLKIPSYKSCFLAMMRRFYDKGVTELNGHLLYALPDGEYAAADAWLERQGIAGPDRRGRRRLAGRTGAVRRRRLRQGRVAVRRGLAGRRRAEDLRRRRGRAARIPRARRRTADDERRRMARVR